MQKIAIQTLRGKAEITHNPDAAIRERRARFARQFANHEFGKRGLIHAWRWRDFRDASPARITRMHQAAEERGRGWTP